MASSDEAHDRILRDGASASAVPAPRGLTAEETKLVLWAMDPVGRRPIEDWALYLEARNALVAKLRRSLNFDA